MVLFPTPDLSMFAEYFCTVPTWYKCRTTPFKQYRWYLENLASAYRGTKQMSLVVTCAHSTVCCRKYLHWTDSDGPRALELWCPPPYALILNLIFPQLKLLNSREFARCTKFMRASFLDAAVQQWGQDKVNCTCYRLNCLRNKELE